MYCKLVHRSMRNHFPGTVQFIPGMDKRVLSSSKASSPVLGFTHLPMQWPRKTLSLGVTWPGREDDLLTLSNCEVKKSEDITLSPYTHYASLRELCRTYIRGLPGKYPAILNISRTGRVALMQLGSQSEETLLHIREETFFRGAS